MSADDIGVDRRRRIGVNLLWLVPGVVGGTEEHTTRLLAILAARGDDHRDLEIVLFVNRSFGAAHPDVVGAFETVVAPVDGSNRISRVAAEATWLAWIAPRIGIDLIHHAGGTMPAIRTRPGIVSIHDLQPLTFPEHFGRLKRTYLGLAIPRSARRARRVVVLSEWARDDVVSRIGIPSDRVVVVSPGIGSPPQELSPRLERTVLERYGLSDRRFFLFPAITYPHKNHAVLVDALALVAVSHPDVKLVLTGGSGPSEGDLHAAIDGAGLRDSVVRPGRIPVEELDVLYRRAAALTFPSLYEGFGLPVLEAMVRGCPVIAADTTALREIVDGAGALVDPHDPRAWAAEMCSSLDDQGRRDDAIAAGLQRAALYGWAHSAEVLEDVYRVASR